VSGPPTDSGSIVRWAFPDRTFRVARDRPLLPSLLDAGSEVPFTCMQGHCGRCRAALVRGEVRAGAAIGLDDHERAAGIVLLCTAYPGTARLELGPLAHRRAVATNPLQESP
jgi:ring-1,2-phenylacetyl-CoA epoxidase subunit PaaE